MEVLALAAVFVVAVAVLWKLARRDGGDSYEASVAKVLTDEPATVREMMERGFPNSEAILRHQLNELIERGIVGRTGKGGTQDPYRYHRLSRKERHEHAPRQSGSLQRISPTDLAQELYEVALGQAQDFDTRLAAPPSEVPSHIRQSDKYGIGLLLLAMAPLNSTVKDLLGSHGDKVRIALAILLRDTLTARWPDSKVAANVLKEGTSQRFPKYETAALNPPLLGKLAARDLGIGDDNPMAEFAMTVCYTGTSRFYFDVIEYIRANYVIAP